MCYLFWAYYHLPSSSSPFLLPTYGLLDIEANIPHAANLLS